MVEDDRNNYGEPISISPDNVRAEIGEEIILTCQCSNPEFTLTWTKLQDRLPPNAQNRSKTCAFLPAVRLSDFESCVACAPAQPVMFIVVFKFSFLFLTHGI